MVRTKVILRLGNREMGIENIKAIAFINEIFA